MKAAAAAPGLSAEANEDACLSALAALSNSKINKTTHQTHPEMTAHPARYCAQPNGV